MPLWKQALLRRLHEQANDGTGDKGGGGGDGKGGEKKEEPPKGNEPGNDDGKKKPTDEEARLLKENMQKKEKIEKLTSDLTAANNIVAAINELGGIDALKTLVGEKKDAETKALEAKGEWDRLKQRMAEEHTKTLKAEQDKVAEKDKALQAAMATINELTVGSAFSNSKFIGEDLVLTPAKTRVVYGEHFDLVDGKVVGYDKPRGAANRTPLVDASGSAVAFDEALKKIVEADPEKESVLRSKAKPGAGSGSAKTVPDKKQEDSGVSIDKISAGLKGLKIGVVE